MYVTTNSSLVWKRVADENQHSARVFARVAGLMFVLLLGTGAYAFSTNARYDDLCTTLEIRSQNEPLPSARKLGESIARSYCS